LFFKNGQTGLVTGGARFRRGGERQTERLHCRKRGGVFLVAIGRTQENLRPFRSAMLLAGSSPRTTKRPVSVVLPSRSVSMASGVSGILAAAACAPNDRCLPTMRSSFVVSDAFGFRELSCGNALDGSSELLAHERRQCQVIALGKSFHARQASCLQSGSITTMWSGSRSWSPPPDATTQGENQQREQRKR